MKAPVLGSVLVVRLLRSGAGQSVLGLAGARAQAIQSPTVLCIIDVVLKEKLKEHKSFKHFQPNFDFFLLVETNFRNYMNLTIIGLLTVVATSFILKKAMPVSSESDPA